MFKNYFIFFMIVGFAALFYFSANAQKDSPEDLIYHACADKVVSKLNMEISRDPSKFQRDVCKFIKAEVGENCKTKLQALSELGFLQDEMNRFVHKALIEPACGPHPR